MTIPTSSDDTDVVVYADGIPAQGQTSLLAHSLHLGLHKGPPTCCSLLHFAVTACIPSPITVGEQPRNGLFRISRLIARCIRNIHSSFTDKTPNKQTEERKDVFDVTA